MPVGICYHKTIEHCTFATGFGSNVYALLVGLSEFEFHKFVVQIALASCGCSSGCGCGLCLWLCSVVVAVLCACACGCGSAVGAACPCVVVLLVLSHFFWKIGKVPFQCPSSPFWFLKKSVALNVAKLFAIAHTFLQSCSLFNAGWVAKSLRFLKESSDFANCNQVILPVLGCFCFCGQVFGATAIDFVGKLLILTRWAARGPPGIIFLCMRESFGPSF